MSPFKQVLLAQFRIRSLADTSGEQTLARNDQHGIAAVSARSILVAVGIVLGLFFHSSNVLADTCLPYDASANYQLVFEENFDGDSLDRNTWNAEFLWGPGVIINNEQQYYVNDGQFDYNPFEVSDGTLKIRAIKTPFRRDVLYLTRSIYSASAAELLWRVPAGAVSYDVFRDGRPVATVTGGSYLDTTLDDGGDFQFEVVARDAAGREILRGQTTVNTGERPVQTTPRPFALYLSARIYGPGDGEIVWETPNRAGRYEIFRDGNLYRVLNGADFSSLYESGLQRGRDYHYEVVSYDLCGEEIIRDQVVLNTADPVFNPGANQTSLRLSDTVFSPSTAEIAWQQVSGATTYQVERNGVVIQNSDARSIFIDGLVPGIDQRYVITALDADGRAIDSRRRTLNTADNSFALNRQPFLSGIITSYDAFRFLYGRVEARAKMPAGKGLWSAFWLLNGYYNEDQPEDPEIDIIEAIGDQVNTANHAYHVRPGGGNTVSREGRAFMPDFSADFHTYGVEWTPGRIIWSVDGRETYRVEGDDVSSEQMYLLANLAVGGDFPGPPDETTPFPSTYEIDYIRVWQRQ